jgi:hypothetical protein
MMGLFNLTITRRPRMVSIADWRRRLNSSLLFDEVVRRALALEHFDAHCREIDPHDRRRSFWSPSVTLLTFLLQVLSGEKTLRAAVASLLNQMSWLDVEDRPSPDPSAYCQARKRLPLQVLDELSENLAKEMQAAVEHDLLWKGHRVKKVDGTKVSMPDKPELQKVFPQPSGQKPGCGFPVCKLVVMFCWATGAVIHRAIGNLNDAEITLFRQRYTEWLEPGDVILGDRHYGSYIDLVRLEQQGVFCVYRLHHRRSSDFRQGRRLSKNDRLVQWKRPRQWLTSFGISKEELERLPETLAVRMIRVTNIPKGFRSRTVFVVTTLRDPVAYPAKDIAALYGDRWSVELNIRSLKTHLGMELLRGKSVDVVRKEISGHLLIYNLIRLLMWRAARQHGRSLHRLSFTGTMHRLRQVAAPMILAPGRDDAIQTARLLEWIADDLVPDRPNRFEPRRRKRRPKEYSLLTKPRSWYREHGDEDAR